MGGSPYRTGLTWRVIFALLIATLFFVPINLYLNLVTGGTISSAALYVIVLLFSLFAEVAGSFLTQNEIFVMYASIAATVSIVPPYYWLVYRTFFVNSPSTYAYVLNGIPLPHLVPSWLAPPPGDPAHYLRTLIQPAWAEAIVVSTFFFITSLAADVGLGILLSYLFVELERLPFPLAQVDYSLIQTISERKGPLLRVFLAGFYAGLIYGAVAYSGQAIGVQLIPLPWADLTWFTEKYMPGALIGIATDPSFFALGLVLDPKATLSMLVGSVVVWVFMNWLFTIDSRFFPLWASEYRRGMTLAIAYQRSFQRVWIAPQFGVALGLALSLVLFLRRSIVKIFRLAIAREAELGTYNIFPPMRLALVLFLVGSLSSVALHHILIPEFPVYVTFLTSTLLSLFIAVLAARAVGEIGFFPTLPWPWQAIVYLTPYSGYAGWVQSPYISLGGQAGMCQMVKVAYLTRTKPSDYFKALVLGTLLSVAVGFVVMDLFWRLAPIPSSVYPNSMVFWPMYATNDALFVTRQIQLDPTIIVLSLAVSLALTLSTPLVSRILLPIPLLSGCFIIPPYAVSIFVGSMLGRLLRRYVGDEKWNEIRGPLAAGILTGAGVFVGISISLLLVARAAWIWPW
ncbi:MAG: OPT/YSL family transporter [Thermofilaceae archaeon]|nr:OPT/YSL family transporter [Thermofilaceae archaeon]MCX8181220.1 OPT/YSL family transporter [Thermofilaceae archaeon]MDW8003561.1 OPT/YSL family transporter [Thermofilaceae archaeon]